MRFHFELKRAGSVGELKVDVNELPALPIVSCGIRESFGVPRGGEDSCVQRGQVIHRLPL